MYDELLTERYELCTERIALIQTEKFSIPFWDDFFEKESDFLLLLADVCQKAEKDLLAQMSLSDLQDLNAALYEDIFPVNYDTSYGNPAYMAQQAAMAGLGSKMAKCLCYLYAQFRGLIPYAFRARKDILTLYFELFIETYGMVADSVREEIPINPEFFTEAIYWFESDNCDILVPDRILANIDASRDFEKSIIMNADLSDLRYLYLFGDYISENEIRIATFLNTLDEEQINAMASTFTEGYRIGFVKAGKPLHKKKTANVRYNVGFERVTRAAIRNLIEIGLDATIYTAATLSQNRKGVTRIGYYGTLPNRQYEYDHREDEALYLTPDYANRKVSVTRDCYEQYKEMAAVHAGPAVQESFGENPFTPIMKKESITLSEKQQKLSVDMARKIGDITYTYIPGDERSFTIISYPIPEIGEKFEEIFSATVAVNTLDYKLYESIQQKIIDTLDRADSVHIVGKGDNVTDLTVALYQLTDPDSQTKFENCVADVNIPVGEVFTSPSLSGTNGVLHVTGVYLDELFYKDLKITFKDGCISDFICSNYESEEENRNYIRNTFMRHHESLPMGEFAIGTNTTAYRMARDYDIVDRLQILIGEKTGPHFAVGDTCYSHEEDVKVYNPDGKEIIARENDFSRKRDTDSKNAYFNCHTDITIPYDELGGIYAICPDGDVAIIEDGRFVLPGCEELNIPLNR